MTSTQHSQSLEGQFDALGNLAPEALANLGKWWKKNGKPAFADVASSRSMAALAGLSFSVSSPRLA